MSSPDHSDLSLLARDLARELDARTVVALGCPRPQRLAALTPDLELIALDRADRLEELRRAAAGAECHQWNPAIEGSPPLDAERRRGAIAVCDGVLETLARTRKSAANSSPVRNGARLVSITQ